MTTTITGRNRYADKALTTVTVRKNYGDPLLVIEGGYIETRGDEFVLAAKHASATDVEGDSSYVAHIEGAGLVWKGMLHSTHTFTGVVLEAKYVTDEDAQTFIDKNGYLKFTPPLRKFEAGIYTIEVRHHTQKSED